MLNQYFDSALPVDTCLRLQSRNQANLFFLKIVKKNFLVIAHGRLAIERNSFIHKYVNQSGTKSLR